MRSWLYQRENRICFMVIPNTAWLSQFFVKFLTVFSSFSVSFQIKNFEVIKPIVSIFAALTPSKNWCWNERLGLQLYFGTFLNRDDRQRPWENCPCITGVKMRDSPARHARMDNIFSKNGPGNGHDHSVSASLFLTSGMSFCYSKS